MITYQIIQREVSINGLFHFPELGPHWTVDLLIGRRGLVKPLGVFFTSREEADCAGFNLCIRLVMAFEERWRQQMAAPVVITQS